MQGEEELTRVAMATETEALGGQATKRFSYRNRPCRAVLFRKCGEVGASEERCELAGSVASGQEGDQSGGVFQNLVSGRGLERFLEVAGAEPRRAGAREAMEGADGALDFLGVRSSCAGAGKRAKGVSAGWVSVGRMFGF